MNLKNKIVVSFAFISITNLAFATPINIACFKDYGSFEATDMRTEKVKLDSGSSDIFFLQDENLVPFKIFSEDKKISIPFKITSVSSGDSANQKYINDGNEVTSYGFDDLSDKNKTIVLDFGSKIGAGSFESSFSIGHNGPIIFSVSDDNSAYHQISEYNLSEFGFRYLKIVFPNNKEDATVQKTEIREINFSRPANVTYLVNPLKISTVNIYRKYDCNFDSIKETLSKYTILNQKVKFAVDANSAESTVNFQSNKDYNNDFDSDGVVNDKDNCPNEPNADQADSDGDLVGDKCDFDNTSKNPLDSDIDKDGVGDSLDNCKYIYNPDQKDSNGDGLGDVCMDDDGDGIIGNRDNCPNVANPDQKDINANNIGDACEFDKDKDSIFDSIDNCINTPNPDQADSDSDGIGDICDNCKLYNPDQQDKNHNGSGDTCEEQEAFEKKNDKDKDGIMDFQDNCQNTPNPGQADSDKDGVGDVCDNCLNIQNTNQWDEDKNGTGDMCEDVDKDGVDGFKDNCPTVANPDQKDSDNNGTGDVCEDTDGDGIIFTKDNCPYNYNPDQNDVDKDGKGDACDTKDDRYMESNKGFFVGLMILIVAVFGVGIFGMVKKLNK